MAALAAGRDQMYYHRHEWLKLLRQVISEQSSLDSRQWQWKFCGWLCADTL